MSQPRQLLQRSSSISLAAAATTALSLFTIFRLGVEFSSLAAMGCWSLLQGLLVVARLPESGAGSNITRFVALYARSESPICLWRVAGVSLLVGSVPVIALCAVLTPFAFGYLASQHSGISQHVVSNLSYSAAGSAVLASVSTMLLCCVEGAGFLIWRNCSTIACNVVAAAAAYPLLALCGASGIGYTYVLLYAVQVVLAVGLLSLARRSINRRAGQAANQATMAARSIFSSLWRANLQMSLVVVLRLSFEPVTKLALSAVGNLAAVAAFELALRVSTQMRVLVQAALQPLVAKGARSGLAMSTEIGTLFRRANSSVSRVSHVLVGLQLSASPMLSILGLGYLEWNVIVFSVILSIGNYLNSLGLVGYTVQLTSGVLKPLVTIQSFMAALNIAVGGIGVISGSRIVVVAAYSGSFALGGMYCIYLLHRAWDLHLSKHLGAMISWADVSVLGGAGVAVVAAGVLSTSSYVSAVQVIGLSAVLSFVFVIIGLRTISDLRGEAR